MPYTTNKLRTVLNAGQRAVGVTAQFASPEVVEVAGHLGFDFIWIDAEHGTMDLTTVVHMIRAANATGVSTLIRVPDSNPTFISRLLDAGADGIIVPHVRTKADAEAIVASAKYAPLGRRAACPTIRATGHGAIPWEEYSTAADRDVHVWGIIEDVDGVTNIDEIVQVPGLDGLIFGPFDLSVDAGLNGDRTHPTIKEYGRRVHAAAARAGVEVMALVKFEDGGLEAAIARGAKVFMVGGDRGHLLNSWRSALARVR